MAISKRAKQIATTNTNIYNLYKRQTDIKNELEITEQEIAKNKTIQITSTNPAVVAEANAKLIVFGEEKIALKNKLKKVTSDLDAASQLLAELIGIPKKGIPYKDPNYREPPALPSLSATDLPKGPTLTWKYNPPMVKAAYLTPTGLQSQDSKLPVTSPGTWDDARKAWVDSIGSKGVIQMSRAYPYQNKTKEVGTGPDKTFSALRLTEDGTVYGFKFLYNPTTVTMSWGVGSEIDIAKFTAGSFKSAPITDAAMNSNVTFSIVLNRMLDMNVVNSNGAVTGDPYPVKLSAEDAKEIYKKGTMLDLEYLFRAVNGRGSDYNSSLNGMTADLGWLNSFPVELHLGSGLRYLVRVTQVNVDHKIFNERMVPIFSTVDFICKRLPDIPVKDANNR
jgi:hypothetical protein